MVGVVVVVVVAVVLELIVVVIVVAVVIVVVVAVVIVVVKYERRSVNFRRKTTHPRLITFLTYWHFANTESGSRHQWKENMRKKVNQALHFAGKFNCFFLVGCLQRRSQTNLDVSVYSSTSLMNIYLVSLSSRSTFGFLWTYAMRSVHSNPERLF